MRWTMVLAIMMLVVWAIGTWLEWGGWAAGLLTGGVFLLIWSTVSNKRQTANGKRHTAK